MMYIVVPEGDILIDGITDNPVIAGNEAAELARSTRRPYKVYKLVEIGHYPITTPRRYENNQ